MWTQSYTARALLAIAFLVGFYLIAIATALLLMTLPLLEYLTIHRIHIQFLIFGIGGGGVILWSLVPRFKAFKAPGKQISPSEHPRLFALIQEVGQAMGLEPPSEVYLVQDVNAFVSQRGGLLGYGGRRYMGIGVPLLAFLNQSQLKALLAHEYGHFAGGETRLSGLIYATRSSMIRTLQNLEQSGNQLLQRPFQWMFETYLRITQAISRQQELLADAWAVKLAGPEAHISTLELVHLNASAYDIYLRTELAPLGQMEVAPDNYFEGFRLFLRSSIWTAESSQVSESLKAAKSDPYDSHPSTEERIAFARSQNTPELPIDATPAWSLLTEPEAVERSFSDFLRPAGRSVLSWHDIGRAWQKRSNRCADRVQARVPSLTLATLEAQLSTPEQRQALVERIAPVLIGDRSPEYEAKASDLLASYLEFWLGSLLGTVGFEWVAPPGEPVRLQRGELVFNLSEHTRPALQGKTPLTELFTWLKSLGLSDNASWPVQEANRQGTLAPRCKVRLEEGKDFVEVVALLPDLHFPQCCALCGGPYEFRVTQQFQIGGFLKSSEKLAMHVPTCAAHQNDARKAWDVRALDRRTGKVTIRFKHPPYARLLERCNH